MSIIIELIFTLASPRPRGELMSLPACRFTANATRAGLEAARQALAQANAYDRADILALVILQWHGLSLSDQQSSLALLRHELPSVLPLGARFRLALALAKHRCDLDDSLQREALAVSASVKADSPLYRYNACGLA